MLIYVSFIIYISWSNNTSHIIYSPAMCQQSQLYDLCNDLSRKSAS